jgi:ATP-binding cassette subfamily B protein
MRHRCGIRPGDRKGTPVKKASKEPSLTTRELAGSARFAIGLAWQASRADLLYVILAQLVTSIGIVGILLLLRGSLGDVAALFSAQGRDDNPRVVILLMVLLLAGTVSGIMRVISSNRQRVLILKVDHLIMRQVLRAASRAELTDFEHAEFHDRLQRAVFASRSQPTMIILMVISLLQAVLTVLAVTVTFLIMAWWLVPLALLSGLPVLRAARNERNAGYGLHHDLSGNRRLREYIERLLTGRDEAKEIRALNLGPPLRGRWDAEYTREIDGTAAMYSQHSRSKILARLAADALIAGVIAVVWSAVQLGVVDLATALTALTGLWLLSMRTQMIAAMMSNLSGAILYLKDLREFISSTGLEEREGEPESEPGVLPAGSPFGKLSTADVSFCYPGSKKPALRKVSIHLNAGEIVALVGINGSGKTTLAKILAGLYRPDTGHVLRDGAAVEDPVWLREASAVVFQDFVRYKLSATDNVAFGRSEVPVDPARVESAAWAAGAGEFLAGLSDGYDTVLSKEFADGADLSIGQWQRLALARAFYRDSSFVILDEPTASLDPQAEADLFSRMRELFAGRTVLLISHRFSSVRGADRIYVLDRGEVIEQGTHESLMVDDGKYARLFQVQAEGYQESAAVSSG